METNLLLQKNAIIILRKMITIEKRHFHSKQDFHLELYPIGNLKSFMSGPPVSKETLVLISTIHRRLAQLRLTISTIHCRLAQLRLTISTIHRRWAHKELSKNAKSNDSDFQSCAKSLLYFHKFKTKSLFKPLVSSKPWARLTKRQIQNYCHASSRIKL